MLLIIYQPQTAHIFRVNNIDLFLWTTQDIGTIPIWLITHYSKTHLAKADKQTVIRIIVEKYKLQLQHFLYYQIKVQRITDFFRFPNGLMFYEI